MNLIEFYTSVLTGFGLSVSEDGLVYLPTNGELKPVKIDSKQICLPTKDKLRDSPWDVQVAFHPICENSAKGEYPTLKWLRKQANYNLTNLIGELWAGLSIVANNKDLHVSLNPNQCTMLRIAHEIDAKCVKHLQTILSEKVSLAGAGRLISLTQKQGGVIGGITYKRICNVSFPITEQFDNESNILGVDVRKKDMKTIKGLFEYILPNHEELEAFNYGSDEFVAPYFHSLLGAYQSVIARIKEVANDFDNVLTNAELFRNIDMNWADHFNELSKYKGLVPPLDGNRHVDSEVENTSEKRVGFGNKLADKVTEFKEPIKPEPIVNNGYVQPTKTTPSEPVETPSTKVVEWSSSRSREIERERYGARRDERESYRNDDRDRGRSRGRERPLDARERAKQQLEAEADFADDFYEAVGYEANREDFEDFFENWLDTGMRAFADLRNERSRDRNYRSRNSRNDDRDRGRNYERAGDRFYSRNSNSNSTTYRSNRR